MLTKEEFIEFILNGPQKGTPTVNATFGHSALPEGFEGFDAPEVPNAAPGGTSTFARRLLEASAFGYPELVGCNTVIRSTDAVARYLPDRVSFWPKTPSRPYQTLLFETPLTHRQLLEIPAFRNRRMSHLDIVEDALARLVSEALDGFQRGGESVTADVRKGRREETLCIISVVDEREGESVRLVCFGTQNKITEGLETFQITERTRFWDRALAREHLGLVYERQFKKLSTENWQEAFTTTEERKKADRLVDVCTRRDPKEVDIQEGVLDLLDTIAKGFGLRRKPNTERRLQAFALPPDHDIGIDPEERSSAFGGRNPFGGVTLRDERSRLLGYIVYPLTTKGDATRLRRHLETNNRFHNVLVVYPDQDQANLELWQGREQLSGKLRKGQGYKDAAEVVNLLSRFFVVSKAKVRNPTELAQELAYRARYLRRLAVMQLQDEAKAGPLRDLYNGFKEALVHTQTEDEFADAFAQTITYGLLTARWIGNDDLATHGEPFTRRKALEHLPPSTPFLNDIFSSALSVRLDEQRGRLLWLVDDVTDLLDRVDVKYVFGAGDAGADTATDPIIHFYEPFLAAYDKKLKDQRGVFFTPRPVVTYIVRTVHERLQSEFGLEDGLASIDSWGDVAARIESVKIPHGVKSTDPFICILDPATGTGTFLFECIDIIERTVKEKCSRSLKAKDVHDLAVIEHWRHYVSKHLLPRLYGYELMMASYVIAHLKLSFKLSETGYTLAKTDRVHVYLTNSLEGPSGFANPQLASLFSSLAEQAQEVDSLKRSHRFSVIIGNPPYAGHSGNSGVWARALVERYRKIENEELRLAQGKWLQNDYVKFIALAETTVALSGAGVVGLITDHSYLEGDTFPGLRYQLLKRFSGMEILDLHGSLTRRDTPPDGGTDLNVFDIQQGVAILLAWLPKPPRAGLANLVVADLWGERAKKFAILESADCRTHRLTWTGISNFDKRYLFVDRGSTSDKDTEYASFDAIEEMFSENGKPAPGFLTTHDSFAIAHTKAEIIDNVEALLASNSEEEARALFKLCSQEQWDYRTAKTALRKQTWRQQIRSCLYRPFDHRWTVYDPHVLVHRRERVTSHLLEPGNIALLTSRMTKGDDYRHVFVTDKISEVICLSSKTSANAFVFPLFLRDSNPRLSGMSLGEEKPNLAASLVRAYVAVAGESATPRSIFFYCYAILHSPAYRGRYNEMLIRDFPRIPRPATAGLFTSLVLSGKVLVEAHLGVEHSAWKSRLRGEGNNVVAAGMPKFDQDKSRVLINSSQYFTGVSPEVWEYKIGSYEVCRKWLSERKSRSLSAQDCSEFGKVVQSIEETLQEQVRIDQEISKFGGWPGAFSLGGTAAVGR